MSTNFYWHHNPCDSCHRVDVIHIGKRSAGWKFLFRGYRQPFDAAVPPITARLDWVFVFENYKGNIRDEYDNPSTIEEFLLMVDDYDGRLDPERVLKSNLTSYRDEIQGTQGADNDGYEFLFRGFS